MLKTIVTTTTGRRAVLAAFGCLAAASATIGIAPTASAEPDCSEAALSNTVSTTTGSAQQYLAGHPGADAVLSAAATQSPGEAATNVRSYFTAHPQEYYELRNILAPIGEAQTQCNTTVLPAGWASAYDQFMAG